MSLAAKLPYDHPYAGGYPGIGSQPLPTDADAIDYLSRMATADGAGVEVGVAVAVDAFVAALKADSLWESIGSSCLLCGPRTLAGALVPLRGDAPTAYGFVAGDHFQDTGLQGDGTSYLDSGRANDADPQNDCHVAVYETILSTGGFSVSIGSATGTADFSATQIAYSAATTRRQIRVRDATSSDIESMAGITGFFGGTRSSASAITQRAGGTNYEASSASVAHSPANMFVFRRSLASGAANEYYSNAKIAFYSIGTSLDLAKLDSHVSAYVTAIGAAL